MGRKIDKVFYIALDNIQEPCIYLNSKFMKQALSTSVLKFYFDQHNHNIKHKIQDSLEQAMPQSYAFVKLYRTRNSLELVHHSRYGHADFDFNVIQAHKLRKYIKGFLPYIEQRTSREATEWASQFDYAILFDSEEHYLLGKLLIQAII